ncbi:hypothetical protein [Paraburkholderia sp.]|uniref:hypothetical protein n=1 Tax=Paraburkholderia sp. TaxID=1926495 RepID=UPI00239A019B|nr:hypothetical protein [Paraburkholderia sp.]MDE1180707.1 hypothetical protein [Paraburkholderia sp.]
MTTTFATQVGPRFSPHRTGVSQWFAELRKPPETWSGRRRGLTAGVIALAIFALCARGWIAADLGGVDASHAALDSANRQVADARASIAALPSLRRDAASFPTRRPDAHWTSADDARVVSQVAAQSGIELLALEPGVASGIGLDAMRPIQFSARTDFAHLMAFARALSMSAPVLAVPVDLTVKRNGGALSVNGTLHVYNALSPLVVTSSPASGDIALDDDPDEELVFFDPFSAQQAGPGEFVSSRLMGVLRDRTRSLALLETPEGGASVDTGQAFGTERVARIDAQSVTLTGRDGVGARTLALAAGAL